MTSVYLFDEQFTNGMQTMYLSIFTIAAILAGILVITIKNPIVSVLYLIGLFLCISIYLMSLGINFIGLAYLLVYVGAVSILFLFILMLINIRISEIATTTSNNIPIAVIIGTAFFYTVIQASPSIVSDENSYYIYTDKSKYTEIFNSLKAFASKDLGTNKGFNHIIDSTTNKELAFLSQGQENTMLDNNDTLSKILIYKGKALNNSEYIISQSWTDNIIDYSHINTLGNVIYTSYPLWLLITSLILLLAMVGTIIITIRERE